LLMGIVFFLKNGICHVMYICTTELCGDTEWDFTDLSIKTNGHFAVRNGGFFDLALDTSVGSKLRHFFVGTKWVFVTDEKTVFFTKIQRDLNQQNMESSEIYM
jgi:hypothetical protein